MKQLSFVFESLSLSSCCCTEELLVPPVNLLVQNLTPIIIGESRLRSIPAQSEIFPLMPAKSSSTIGPPKELLDFSCAFLNTESCGPANPRRCFDIGKYTHKGTSTNR